MLVFIMILPRLTDSLISGNGGNPDLVLTTSAHSFYPAVIGWTLLAVVN